jgi:DNA repair protein RadA/Sms
MVLYEDMAKTLFKCQQCGYESAKWQGKCHQCEGWNTFKEVVLADTKISKSKSALASKVLHTNDTKIHSLKELSQQLKDHPQQFRYGFNSKQLQSFWGGGIAASSVTLLAGEPGLGKSTLALQLLRAIDQKTKLKTLYITAEESSIELARRCQRLGIPDEVIIAQAARYEEIEKILLSQKPDVVIVDSIQTIYSAELTGSPGSVSQVTGIATGLLNIAKTQDIALIIIGHVTKDGSIAGPRTLEHLVDSVLILERSKSNYRTLAFQKNRFGNTDEILLLKMVETGLEIITDPSLALLENIESGIGVVYGLVMEKNMAMVIEAQALVTGGDASQMYGRRESIGFPVSRLHTVLAIAEKYLKLNLRPADVYIKLSGLNSKLEDESLDLVILLAILSSYYQQEIGDLLTFEGNKHVFAARLTLSGKIRKPTHLEQREKAVARLNFSLNTQLEYGNVNGLKLIQRKK